MRAFQICIALLATGLLVACDDDDDRAPRSQSSTQRLIVIASQTDETAEPFPVNDGAFVFDDTAENTEPVPITR
ncbi:hypothetical protein [Sinimarinibacterium thermocellulolyticum]|uniref:Uncharacterized protein n=1 Tax=Sinimarinibacterium thermocellulolyticum TaxID=3170016 RepID=A0ABV2A615_9GAMM